MEPIAQLISKNNDQFILDSIPIPICQNPGILRSKICKDDLDYLPARGYHASHNVRYFGYKLQLVVSKAGVPISLGLTAANVHDVHYLNHLTSQQLNHCELIADNGYLSEGHQTSLFHEFKISLITPLRANMVKRKSSWNGYYRYTRKRIETLFSQLCDQLYLKRNYAKTLNGLFTRIWTKITSVAILQYVNFLNNKPINNLKHALAY